jgi:predicted dienelactone hydrolase
MARIVSWIAVLAACSCGSAGGNDSSTSSSPPASPPAGAPSGSSSGGSSSGAGSSGEGDAGGAAAPGTDAGGTDACAPPSTPPPDAPACGTTKLLARPADPTARGPWAVGAHTSTVAGLTTEIWYPAKWGSDACQTPATYDIRQHLPPADQNKIPDSANPLQECGCYRDLPIDDAHGPYPVITFIHGTAAFRTQSLTFMTHWASRGFVVVSSDHPHIQLGDVLQNLLGAGSANEQGDALAVLSALDAPSGDLAFLAGHLDMTRMGASGHSAGGGAVASIASARAGIQVVIPMSAGGVDALDAGAEPSSLVMSAQDDGIAAPSSQTSGYASTPSPKRFVQLSNAGHLAFSDLCYLGAAQGGLLAIAEKYGVTNAGLIAPLASDGCAWQTGKSYTPITPQQGWAVVEFATSAVFEETLMCDTAMTSVVAGIQSAVPNVASYQQAL